MNTAIGLLLVFGIGGGVGLLVMLFAYIMDWLNDE